MLFGASIIVAFLLSPVIVRELGNHNYGLWETIQALTGFLGILEIGIGPAVSRYVAVYHASNNRDSVLKVLNSSLAVLSVTGFACFLCVLILSFFSSYILGVPDVQIYRKGMLFLLSGFGLLLAFPGTALVGFVLGMQRHYVLNTTRTITTILAGIGCYFAMMQAGDSRLLWMVLIGIVTSCFHYATFAAIILLHEPRAFGVRHVSFSVIRELYLFGAKSLVMNAAVSIFTRSMSIVISHTVGISSVVFFAIPKRLFEYAEGLTVTLGYPLTPFFASMSGRDSQSTLRTAWLNTSRALQFFALGFAVAMAFLGEPFLHRWMGPSYAANGRYVVWILSFSLFLNGIACNSNRLLVSTGTHGRAGIGALLLVFPVLCITVVLAFLWGVSGIAVGVMLFSSGNSGIQLAFALRQLDLKVSEFIRQTTGSYALPLAALAIVLAAGRQYTYPGSYLHLLGLGSLSAIVYAVFAWTFSLNREERGSFTAIIRSGGLFRSLMGSSVKRSADTRGPFPAKE